MNRNHTYRAILAIGLLALFVVPTFVPALHELLDRHDHYVCTAHDDGHWHAQDDCELCDFLVTIKLITPERFEIVELALESWSATVNHVQPWYSGIVNTNYLRGPPMV